MNKEIDFRTSGYFSGPMIFLAGGLLLAGLVALLSGQTTIGLIILFFGILMQTTHCRLRINLNNHEYYNYVWILGLKRGEKGKFESIEYVFIKKSMVSQRMNSIASTTTIRKEVFDGYLKFSDEVKVHLMTRDNKDSLLKKLKVISSRLQTKIVDYSTTEQ